MEYIDTIEKYLPKILDKIREDIENNETSSEFIENKEQLHKLISTQEVLIQKYLKEFLLNKEFDESIIRKFYGDVNVSYTIVYRSLNTLKTEILKVLSQEEYNKENIYKFGIYLKQFTGLVAKIYIEKEIETLIDIIDSPFSKYLLFNSHKQWIEQLIIAITKNIDNFPIINPQECKFHDYLYYPESLMICIDKNLCMYLDDIHKIIHKTANSFYLFYIEKNFAEGYFVFKDLKEQIFKFTKLLSELYFVTYSRVENSFFKLTDMLQHERELYLSMINIKGLKTLNAIYTKPVISKAIMQLENRLYKFITDDTKLMVLQDRVLAIKAITADFYMINIEYSYDEYVELLNKIKNLLMQPVIIEDVEINFDILIAGFKVRKFSEYKEYEFIKILNIINDRLKATSKTTLIYSDDDELQQIDESLTSKYDLDFLSTKLENNDIEIVVQPVFNINDKFDSIEILGRIKEDDKIIPANLFIDKMYKKQLIEKFDNLVLDKIIKKEIILKKLTNKISINIAFKSLFDDKYMQKLSTFVKKSSLKVVLEISESKMINSFEVIEHIHDKYGFEFAIDDFGIGCFSLKTIEELINKGVLKTLKIDGALIRNIAEDENAIKVVRLLVNLKTEFDIQIGASFIENENALAILKQMKIDLFQGFYLERPDKLEVLLVKKASS